MRKIPAILSSLLLIAALSCERETDLPLKPDGGRLYLECFPSNNHDTTYIKLTAAVPITEYEGPKELSNIMMNFRVNGDSFAPKLYSEDNYVYTYIADVPLKPGDIVSVDASAEGYPQITASSSVPDEADMEMSREIYNYGTLRHKFTVRRNDGSGQKHYYGVAIRGVCRMEKTYADSDRQPETEVSYLRYDYKMESPVKSKDEDILGYKTIKQCHVNGTDMVIFEDDGGKTTDLEIVVDIPYQQDKYWVVVEDYKIFRRTLYNVEMFRIPKEAYEYLNPRINESLLAAGLIPPFISNGNISGGYGIASCMGCTSSGWIGNPI